MVEDAVDDVGDGLEPAVRVPRGALGLTRRVLDLTHLVHVDERVELGEVDAGERAAHREALTLETARGAGDAADGALGAELELDRDARQDSQVGDGDGGHRDLQE